MPTYTLFATSSGSPKTGLSPEFIAWRGVDDTDPPTVAPAIAELTGGLYTFTASVPVGDPDIAFVVDMDPGGAEGVPAAERYQTGTLTADDAAVTETRLAQLDGLGAKLTQVLGLLRKNFRLKNPTYDADGNLTSGTLRVYGSQADASADANALLSLTITATYNGDGNLTSFLSVGG